MDRLNLLTKEFVRRNPYNDFLYNDNINKTFTFSTSTEVTRQEWYVVLDRWTDEFNRLYGEKGFIAEIYDNRSPNEYDGFRVRRIYSKIVKATK